MKRLLIAIFLCVIPVAGYAFFGGSSGGGKKLPTGCSDSQIPVYSASTLQWSCGDPGAATMVYPGAGVAVSSGSTWGTSLNGTNLGLFAAINPSANVQSVLGAANYAAIKTLLGYYTSGDTITATLTGNVTGNVTGNASGSAGSLKSPSTTGVAQLSGMGTGTTRVKTVRDANDTILELGGDYTPSGTWVWTSATATWPTFNQNTTGTAAGLSGTPALPNGTTATTQAVGDSSTKLATTKFVLDQVNSATQPGIVASGAAQNAKVWKTDASGVPGWRDDATGGTPTFDTIGAGTSTGKAYTVGSGGSIGFESTGTINSTHYKGETGPTAVQFGYLDATSSIQTQLNGKQAADADLTTYAGITPSANTQTFLGAVDYAAMRTQLGLVIGTNVQAYDADLTTYAGIAPSANIQTFLGSADFAAARTNLGLAIGTNVQAYDADLTTYAGITPSANIQSLLGSSDYATARTNLGLAIGTNVQAYHASLASVAGLTETAGGTPYFTADNTWAVLGAGSAGKLYRYGSSTAPTWSTLTMPDTIAAGSVFVANSANTLSALTSTSGTYFLRNVDGTLSWAAGVGTIAGSTGSADNALITANGTGGATIQANVATATLSDAGLLTVPTISSGAGGFTVDADGDAVAKTLTTGAITLTKTSGTAGDIGLVESNSTDSDTAGFKGPIGDMTLNTSYRGVMPTARPGSGTNNALVWSGTAMASPNTGNGTVATPYNHQMSFLNLDTTYLGLAGGTLTGKLNVATNGTAAGLNLTQSADAPSSPVNGDIWVTASGLYARYNGTTSLMASGTPAFSAVTGGTNTNALVIGNSGSLAATGTGTITATAAPVAGITGLGTGVATALAVNVGTAGAPVVLNGAGGTPSSITLTNGTGLPVSGITASTSTALGVGSIELGHASDTTLARTAAGRVTIEGVEISRTIASGSATFNPSSVSSGACSSAVDGGTATGVATTDVIDWGFSGDPTSTTGYNPSGDLGYIVAYPTADHVNFKFCNKSGSAIDPGSVTLNWKVRR